MAVRASDSEFALRLIKGTFLIETSINISMMFCLESLFIDDSPLPEYYRKDAVKYFRDLLVSDDFTVEFADLINKYYADNFGDSHQHLESILSILDGPLSFEVSFFFTILDPDLRSDIRAKCFDLAPRYRGSLTNTQARTILSLIFDKAEERLFSDKRFALLLQADKRKELERDFKEYISRYRDSSHEEIQDKKVRFNLGQELGSGVSMPIGVTQEELEDWRSFCRFAYLSNRFAIFPELFEIEDAPTALTDQEVLFLPRPAQVNRVQEGKRIRLFDGIRYCRERMSLPTPKCLNLYGARGSGLSAFARMLSVHLASAYSRGHSKLIPIYIDLQGRTSKDLENLASVIDSEILLNSYELTSTWQNERTVLIIDNFDRVAFETEQERTRFLSSFFQLATILKKGGLFIVTDMPITTRRIGVNLEIINLEDFTESNINDWITSWISASGLSRIPVTQFHPDVIEFFRYPNHLWLALKFSWDELKKRPGMLLTEMLEAIVGNMVDEGVNNVLVGDRRVIDPTSLTEFVKELAWLNYRDNSSLNETRTRELLKTFKLDIAPQTLIRITPTRMLDVKGNKDTVVSVGCPSSQIRDYLIAVRFVEQIGKKAFFPLLGRACSEDIFRLIVELLKRIKSSKLKSIDRLRALRENLWKWYCYSAVAVQPKQTVKSGLAFADYDLFADFRLISLLLFAEVTKLIGDNRPLIRGNNLSLSKLVKALQNNPIPERVDFRKYLAGTNLRGVNFEDIDLEGADFSNCRLDEAKFHRCNMTGVKLQNASLTGGNFENCSMQNVDASNADLTGCTIRFCDLDGGIFREAQFDAATIIYVSFNKSVLVGVKMNKSYCDMVNFVEANLIGGAFNSSNFQGVDFSKAKMIGAKFAECSFSFCMFKETQLTISDFDKSTLDNVMFINCESSGFAATNTKLTDFVGVQCRFLEADFSMAKMINARLRESDFTSANFTGSDLREVDFRKSIFTNVRIPMADFRNATLDDASGLGIVEDAQGADFTNATGVSSKDRMLLKKFGAKDLSRYGRT